MQGPRQAGCGCDKGVDELDAADFEEKLSGAESKAKDALKAAISAKKDDGTAYSKARSWLS